MTNRNVFGWHRVLCGCVALILACGAAFAQQSGSASAAFDVAAVRKIVETTADIVHQNYFDEALAARMDESLRQGLAEGRYASGGTPQALAAKLTEDLYAISHDKHLSVTATPPQGKVTSGGRQSREDAVRVSNAGVQRVEILPGNVGYFAMSSFFRPEEARDAIAGAMHLLKNADALIVDMRDNGGGSPDTVTLVASYFFDEPGVPLLDIVQRNGDAQHYVTQTDLPDRNGTRPMYVLASSHTWSGGEGLPFVLQEHHRAEIIGETTVGAANAARPYQVDETFYVFVPNGHTRSSLSGANWEGTGVKPDVSVPTADALRVAQTHALLQLLSKTPGGQWHDQLQSELGKLEVRPQ